VEQGGGQHFHGEKLLRKVVCFACQKKYAFPEAEFASAGAASVSGGHVQV